MKHFACLALALGVFAAQPVFADDDAPKPQNTKVMVDLKDLDNQTRNTILDNIAENAKDKAKDVIAAAPSPDKMEKWAKIGKGIGDAIAAAAHSLNVGVNEFIKTPAGQLTVWAIFLYLFGKTLWVTAAGIVIWLIVGGLLYGSFRKFHMPYKLKQKDGTVVLASYQWQSKDAKITSVCIHVFFLTVISIICVVAIL